MEMIYLRRKYEGARAWGLRELKGKSEVRKKGEHTAASGKKERKVFCRAEGVQVSAIKELHRLVGAS